MSLIDLLPRDILQLIADYLSFQDLKIHKDVFENLPGRYFLTKDIYEVVCVGGSDSDFKIFSSEYSAKDYCADIAFNILNADACGYGVWILCDHMRQFFEHLNHSVEITDVRFKSLTPDEKLFVLLTLCEFDIILADNQCFVLLVGDNHKIFCKSLKLDFYEDYVNYNESKFDDRIKPLDYEIRLSSIVDKMLTVVS